MAQAQRSGEKFGITPVEPKVDWEAVKAHIADVIATIAPVDSVERFEGLGATVISEYAKFVDPNTVESETTRVRAKRFVVAVGSRASAPPIPGLDKVDYATNDAKGMGGLTHIAGHHASSLFKNFFLIPQGLNAGFSTAKTDRMPAAIYTEPELANIGLTEDQARETYGDAVQVAEFHFDENDRAIAERSTHGGVKIVVGKKGKILGGSVVGAHAGEMIHMLSVAMTGKMKASQLAQIISPYPTRSEAVKRAASSLFTESLFGPKSKVRSAAKFWAKFQ